MSRTASEERWQDRLPDMLQHIEDARHSSETPSRTDRLTEPGKHAAALLSGTVHPGSVEGAQTVKETWSPSSWTKKAIKQSVVFNDEKAVQRALAKLERLPPIVTPAEICRLKESLREVALGKAFLLQGGDCAELFDYCESNCIDAKIKLLLQMSLVLIWGLNKPVVRIARMAGQYAKPRSSATETIDGVEMSTFRGDILNGYHASERTPDPSRLVSAYFHSAATLNYVRAQLVSGIADLHRPLDWDLGHIKDKAIQAEYTDIVHSITESLAFMHTIGADTSGQLQTVDLYTSHEGLVLEYEQTLTRNLPHPANSYDSSPSMMRKESKGWYDTSAHFIWIGDRTRQLDGAHVEFFRGVENPIGIKVGPTMTSEELVQILDVVDPNKEVGKVTLITRYGDKKIEGLLGEHIEAVKASGHTPIFMTDPMHGNTKTTMTGIKTRHFSNILAEVAAAMRIHKEHGSILGGVHLELTGDAVTECVGGAEGLMEEDLSLNYTTFCDPRLNERQALELAFLIAGRYRED